MDSNESPLVWGGLPLDVALQMEYQRGRADARQEIEAAGGPLREAYDRGFHEGVRRHAADRWEVYEGARRFVRRTAREFYDQRMAEMAAREVPTVQTADWPAITMPGTGGR